MLSCQQPSGNSSLEPYVLGKSTLSVDSPAEELFKVENGPSHQAWHELLQEYVNAEGMVDYEGIQNDMIQLNAYLKTLSDNPPQTFWSVEEQLAYWINAYNAFAIKLIVDHYPVKSIKDLGPTVKIPLINDVWHYKFFKIGGQDFSLDKIEHGIIREQFDEPRIHFALNCASISCPPLLNGAFLPCILDDQLTTQARLFINDNERNKLSLESVQLSSIFNWFKGDFTKGGDLIEFLNKYSDQPIQSSAKITYLDYDWDLNKQ